MQKFQHVGCVIVVSVLCFFAQYAHGRLPQGLPNLLKSKNFHVYPTPCPANNMVLKNVRGGVIDLASLRGKVVILNFWKIDCQPCLHEKPILERIRRKYAGRGLEILAVNLFDRPERVKSFVDRCGFGFAMCCDPGNRFAVRKQSLGGGMPTTFVLNEKSEAIYEVPGVPTTYVINRNGQVVGNAVGMVNWEEGPLIQLLESLLGSAQKRFAQAADQFTDAAGRGPKRAPPSVQAHITPGNTTRVAQRTPLSQPSSAPAPLPRSAPLPPSAPLPLQESDTSRQEATLDSPAKQAPVEQSGSVRRTPRTQPKRREVPRQATTMPSQRKQSIDRYRTPRPYRPTAQVTGPAGSLPQPTPYGSRGVPPTSSAMPRASSAASPLPAAIPYVRPRLTREPPSQARIPIVPDRNGTVEARIPAYPRATPPTGTESAPQRASSGTPLARPTPGTNPIDGFLLDSFGQPTAPRTLRPEPLRPQQNASAPQPAGSILGQMSRDVRNLGAGIKENLSRLWPLK